MIQGVFNSILDEDQNAAKVAQEVAQLLIMSTPEYSTTTNLVAPNHIERQPTPPDTLKPNTDYNALVFINLFGGMDSLNMLTPHPNGCQALYDEYVEARGDNLALNYTAGEILEIPIGADPTTQPSQPCSIFGVNSHLDELQQMYNDGDAIFFANIGTLSKPVNAANYRGETKVRLFSHFDMKEESMKVDGNGASATGIMGRIADIMGEDLVVGQITLDRTLEILYGDPAVGRKVDVVSSKTKGVDQFYRVSTKVPGVSCPLSLILYGVSTLSQLDLISSYFLHFPSIKPASSKRDNLIQAILALNNQTEPGESGIHANFWSQAVVDTYNESEDYRTLLGPVADSPDIPQQGIGPCLNQIYKLMTLRTNRTVNQDLFGCEMVS